MKKQEGKYFRQKNEIVLPLEYEKQKKDLNELLSTKQNVIRSKY